MQYSPNIEIHLVNCEAEIEVTVLRLQEIDKELTALLDEQATLVAKLDELNDKAVELEYEINLLG